MSDFENFTDEKGLMMSEDTLQRQINELDDKVAAMLALLEKHQEIIECMGKTIVLHTVGIDALTARIAE